MTGRGWLVFCRRARLPASSVFTMGLQPQLWRGRPPRADSSDAGRRGAGPAGEPFPGLQPVAEICYARIGQLFDLACDPRQVARTLGDLAQARPGLRLPGALDAFEQAVRAVLGQLVSVAMAARLTAKVAAGWGEPLAEAHGYVLFPTPEALSRADPQALKALGMPLRRAEALIHLARAALSGELP